jgi:hypothetical protein
MAAIRDRGKKAANMKRINREKIINLIPDNDICGNLRCFMAELGLFALIPTVLNGLAPVFLKKGVRKWT